MRTTIDFTRATIACSAGEDPEKPEAEREIVLTFWRQSGQPIMTEEPYLSIHLRQEQSDMLEKALFHMKARQKAT